MSPKFVINLLDNLIKKFSKTFLKFSQIFSHNFHKISSNYSKFLQIMIYVHIYVRLFPSLYENCFGRKGRKLPQKFFSPKREALSLGARPVLNSRRHCGVYYRSENGWKAIFETKIRQQFPNSVTHRTRYAGRWPSHFWSIFSKFG